MQFGLRLNPGVEARKFLENRINSLKSLSVQEGLNRLKEDIPLIFGGRYDKLTKDGRFRQFFLDQHPNLRLEKTTLGETFIGAFAILDSVFNDRLTTAGNAESRQAVLEEYFSTKLDALEKLFAGDVSLFGHYFILIFLRYTYQQESIEGEKLESVKSRFKSFIDEEDTLLRFFFYLDQFNTLNVERTRLDQGKKTSLSQRLDDEIQHGEPISSLKKQVLICHKLKFWANKLIETSRDHDPLSEIRQVIDEVYITDSQNVIKGLLEKFRTYYEFELEALLEALVYKRIIAMNSGAKVAKDNRKAWIDEMDYDTVVRLVSLLEIKDADKQRLSLEQKSQLESYLLFRKKLDESEGSKADSEKRENPLEESDINLLIHRLGNVSLLEEQISLVEKKLEEYKKKNNVDYQNKIIRTYNENIMRLTQSLYFFVELSAFQRAQIEKKARQIFEEVRGEIEALKTELKEEPSPEGAEAPVEEKTEPGRKEEPGAEAVGEKKSSADEKDPEKRVVLLAAELKQMPDPTKIKVLKEIAYLGGLETLRHILPLSQYKSEFLRNMARNTVIKIILRILKENEEKPVLGIQQKKKLIELVVGLDNKYGYLKDMELTNPKTTQKVLAILIHENADFTARTLSEIVIDEDNKVRATAVKLIADMLNQKESGLLMKLLNDPDARVRANVIESLEAIGNRNVLGILMKYKFDKDNRVRANALKAIWNFGHKEIDTVLQDMLLDLEPKMRASAVWVIGEIGHNQPQLKALLKAVVNDKNEMVKNNLERSMTKISKRENGINVLVADDDIQFCQDMCRKLVKDGFKATAAINGRAALAKTAKDRPDIIFLDLRMPVMNGLEALKALRSEEKTRDLPVIVMSDLNSSILLKQTTKEGANDFLLKPCSYEQVKEKLRSFF
ncbi:MAG TPA: response regulator [archaeon]|nr:response regulator [archaeon]